MKPGGAAVRELARNLVTLRRIGWDVSTEVFDPYADAADRLAAWGLDQMPDPSSRPELVEGVVVGTVVFESVLLALRRLAEEHHSSIRA